MSKYTRIPRVYRTPDPIRRGWRRPFCFFGSPLAGKGGFPQGITGGTRKPIPIILRYQATFYLNVPFTVPDSGYEDILGYVVDTLQGYYDSAYPGIQRRISIIMGCGSFTMKLI